MPEDEGSDGVKSANKGTFIDFYGVRTWTYMAYEPPDFYAIWTDFVEDGGGLQYVEESPQTPYFKSIGLAALPHPEVPIFPALTLPSTQTLFQRDMPHLLRVVAHNPRDLLGHWIKRDQLVPKVQKVIRLGTLLALVARAIRNRFARIIRNWNPIL